MSLSPSTTHAVDSIARQFADVTMVAAIARLDVLGVPRTVASAGAGELVTIIRVHARKAINIALDAAVSLDRNGMGGWAGRAFETEARAAGVAAADEWVAAQEAA